MQISKTILTFGTAALCLAAFSSRAVDTEADIRLREALRQKMAEVGPETTEPAPAPSKPAKKVKAPKPVAPVAPAAPVVAAPAAQPAPVVAPVVAAPVVVEPAPVVAPAQPAAPAPVDDAQAERLREAVRARLAQEAVTPTAPQPVVTTHGSDLEPAVSTTTIVAPATPVQTEVPRPVQQPVIHQAPAAPVTFEAPALPISGSKEARLAALLQQYKADQITPQQYHEQRAKIIAE